jgi:hypothetical protein
MTNPLDKRRSQLKPSSPYAALEWPSAITGIGVMSIVMGAVGLLACGLFYLVNGVSASATVTTPNGPPVPPNQDLATVMLIFGSITIVASASLVLCGAGALLRIPAARNWAIGAAIFILMLSVTRFIATVTYIGPKAEQANQTLKQDQAAKQKPGEAPETDQLAPFYSIGSIAFGVVKLLLESLTPVLILYRWTKKDVVEAFAKMEALRYAAAATASGKGGSSPPSAKG